ncbi:MAG: hypothetical protein KIS94_12220 [Chitinophagales bacterium]|nr:hypothetical protein [Chitinophagales bacterium]
MKSKTLVSVLLLYILFLLLHSCREKTGNGKTSDIKVSKDQTYNDTSTSFVKVYDENGRLCIQQSNTYYELVDLYEGNNKIPLLLKINKVEICVADSLNKHKVYHITANSVMDTKNVHWETEFVATELQFKDNTMLAIHEGVENEEDYLKRFSLRDGVEVFSCSYGNLKVAIPNVRDKRFIGYTSKATATKPIQERKEENLLAVLKYGTSEKLISTVKVKLKRSALAAKIPDYTPEMQLVASNNNTSVIEDGKTVILLKADEKFSAADVKDFSVQLTFYFGFDNESTVITIPVVNDDFDLTRAVYDKDIFEISR